MIRKRCDIKNHEDTTTHGINANARKMLMSKLRNAAIPGELYFKADNVWEDNTKVEESNTKQPGIDLLSSVNHCSQTQNIEPSQNPVTNEILIPQNAYLLTIRNCCSSDILVHEIIQDTYTIGNQDCDINLAAPDIAKEHCRIFRLKPASRKKSVQQREVFCLKPMQGAKVLHNSKEITSETALESSDVVSIGGYYSFIFKNPKQSTLITSTNTVNTSVSPEQVQSLSVNENRENMDPKGEVEKVDDEGEVDSGSENKAVLQWRLKRNAEYESDTSRLKISYRKQQMNEMLENIVNLMDRYPNMFKLSPCYLLCMSAEYSAVKFEQITTRELLIQLANLVQNYVWVSVQITH